MSRRSSVVAEPPFVTTIPGAHTHHTGTHLAPHALPGCPCPGRLADHALSIPIPSISRRAMTG